MPNPLFHFIIARLAGCDKDFIVSGKLCCPFKGMPALAAPASADDKSCFIHNRLLNLGKPKSKMICHQDTKTQRIFFTLNPPFNKICWRSRRIHQNKKTLQT
jgi:hypothetical protein